MDGNGVIMVYKLLLEDGDYQFKDTKQVCNLLEANWADTPEGLNVGWDEFDNIEVAMQHYNIELIKD